MNEIQQRRRSLLAQFQLEQKQLGDQLAARDKEAGEEKVRQDREMVRLDATVGAAREGYQAALGAFQHYEEEIHAVRRFAQPVLAVVFGLLGTGFLVIALMRHVHRPSLYYAAAGLCAALLLLVALRSGLGTDFILPGTLQHEDEELLALRWSRVRDVSAAGGPRVVVPPRIMSMAMTGPVRQPVRPDLEMAQVPVGARPQNKLKQNSRFRDTENQLSMNDSGTGVSARSPSGKSPQPSALMAPVAREYAYQRGGADCGGMCYWHPVRLLTDGRLDGISFDLMQPSSPVQIRVFGNTLDGRLGSTMIELPGAECYAVHRQINLSRLGGRGYL